MKYVYFVRRSDGTGPIKIGCSSGPKCRIRQLEIDLRLSFDILAEAPGNFTAERNLHVKFAHLRASFEGIRRGTYIVGAPTEWFHPEPELLGFIDIVKKTGSLPLQPEDCREKVFAARYIAGETLQAIGSDHGITRERVRQILKKHGVTSKDKRDHQRILQLARIDAWRKKYALRNAA